jgi:hypothetical protein
MPSMKIWRMRRGPWNFTPSEKTWNKASDRRGKPRRFIIPKN